MKGVYLHLLICLWKYKARNLNLSPTADDEASLSLSNSRIT